ncbi:MAG TPA: TonB-dependent receptor [Steroidobacteraceae bacterium]|nr:TonB-dependent receptor [Steroidobacteraceae bacterium]
MKVKTLSAGAESTCANRNFSSTLSKAMRGLLYANVAVAVGGSAFGFSSAVAADAKKAASNDDLEEIVVVGHRAAVESATERKKQSDTIIDSVVADQAGKLPDNSITEVLARIPGITMSRFNAVGDSFSVEGSGIQVRGLSNPSSMMNGREIFSANGGSPLSWGEVTPELMAAVDVYKATRADMIEGGTGGAIDLRTKMPFDYNKTAIQGTVSENYGDLTRKADPSISTLFTTRWDTPIGEMGILADVAYSRLTSQDSHLSVEPYFKRIYNGQDVYIPGGFGWGDDHFQRERRGYYEAFQWQPTENLTIFQTAFSSNYRSKNDGASAWVASDRLMPTSGNAKFDSNGVLISADHMSIGSINDGNAGSTVGQSWIPADQQVDCNTPYGTQAQTLNWGASPPVCQASLAYAGSGRGFSTTDNTTRDFSQGFTWAASDRVSLRGAYQYVNSVADSTGMSVGTFVPVEGYSADLSSSGVPSFRFDANSAALLANSANYGYSYLAWRPSHNRGTMGAGNLDIEFKIGDGFFKKASAGVRLANRVEHDNHQGTYWTPLGNGWDGSDQKYLADGPATDNEYYAFNHFFHGKVPVPNTFYVPSASLIKSQDWEYVMNTYGYYKSMTNYDGTPVASPSDVIHHDDAFANTTTSVKTQSFYLQTKFGSDAHRFDGNFGVRYVRTRTASSGNFLFGAGGFYMSQADANADFADDPTGTSTPRRVQLTGTAAPVADKSVDGRWLPAFNITFKPTDKFYVRFAANMTVSRPSYGDIAVSGNGSVATIPNTNNYTGPNGPVTLPPIFNGITASIGNTRLRPTLSRNYDLSFEWYPDSAHSAHFALFHKDLSDLIIFGSTFVPVPYTFTEENGTVVSGATTLETIQAKNADSMSRISGFEFGGHYFFDSLPGWLSGFGVDANYTYIDSHNPAALSYDMSGNQYKDLPIVGLSKHGANLQLMYQKDKFYAGLAYNWRSRWLMNTNANGTGTTTSTYQYCSATVQGSCSTIHYALPLYGHAYGQLDFGMNYKINDHLKLNLQANNLTNVKAISDMEILPGKFYNRNFYESDRRVEVGVNFAF